MSGEKIPLTSTSVDNGFYSGQEVSTNDGGSNGISRRILHGLTILSVLIAFGCTIYGSIRAGSAVLVLPFVVVLTWVFIHYILLFFAQREQHVFHPPAWFSFISSGHIFIQSLIVIILTLFKKQT